MRSTGTSKITYWMRVSRIIPLLVVLSGCYGSLRVPRGVTLPVRARVAVRADVRVEAPPPPPAHNVIVQIQSAPVPEFFGIPLDNATDVVFVLDISGSMDSFASGQLSQYATTAPANPPPTLAHATRPARADCACRPLCGDALSRRRRKLRQFLQRL